VGFRGPPGRKSARRFAPIGTAALSLLVLVSVATASGGGGTTYYGHVFPVQGSHGVRGAIGEFHAPRSGGRIHEGFDITAGCGTRLVAVRNGRVRRVGFDPVLYGNFVLIHGEGEHRSYFYAHLARPASVHRGQRLWEGERLGIVGETGNAAGTGCHLHFEIHVDGVPIDPLPSLKRWDRYS
jgi:murein DD-endopeptidase MepM/ murein hydrolase activator NlpD